MPEQGKASGSRTLAAFSRLADRGSWLRDLVAARLALYQHFGRAQGRQLLDALFNRQALLVLQGQLDGRNSCQ